MRQGQVQAVDDEQKYQEINTVEEHYGYSSETKITFEKPAGSSGGPSGIRSTGGIGATMSRKDRVDSELTLYFQA
jgi:hypothetical protein